MFLDITPESWGVLVKGLLSLVLTLFGYLLIKNINVIDNLSNIVNDFRREFAAHEERDKGTQKDVDVLKESVAGLQKDGIETKLAINTIKTTLKMDKDGSK